MWPGVVFFSCYKEVCWKVWSLVEEITSIFLKLSNQPTIEDEKESLPAIERFTGLLYRRSSNCVTTNDCRRDLFCQGRSTDNIPPSKFCTLETLRSSYVAGYILYLGTINDFPPSTTWYRRMGIEAVWWKACTPLVRSARSYFSHSWSSWFFFSQHKLIYTLLICWSLCAAVNTLQPIYYHYKIYYLLIDVAHHILSCWSTCSIEIH